MTPGRQPGRPRRRPPGHQPRRLRLMPAAKKLAAVAALAAGLAAAACGGSSSSTTAGSPAQQIAAMLVGQVNQVTGATVVSATVGPGSIDVCKVGRNTMAVEGNTDRVCPAGPSYQQPAADWDVPGYAVASASAELTMSDGTQVLRSVSTNLATGQLGGV
jgi:hypothetical protein